MKSREIVGRIWKSLTLGESTLTVAAIQDSIEAAITRTGIRTKYGRSITFGNTMLISISPEAMEVVAPAQRRVLSEIQEHLPAQLGAKGWALLQQELSLNLVADSTLVGLQMSVRVVDADVTPDIPTGSRLPKAPSTSIPLMRLVELDGTRREWVIDPLRPLVIGSAPPPDSPEWAALTIDKRYVSRIHLLARPHIGPAPTLLINDRSTHGTTVNGTPVTPRVDVHVSHGDVLHLAAGGGIQGSRLRFVVGRPDAEVTEGTTGPL
jgi:hypothetical protein